MWSVTDISFETVDDMIGDPVMTLLVKTPAGQLTFIGEPIELGNTLVVKGTHVQDASASARGHADLLVIAQALMEGMDYYELVVEGAVRTTGANRDHRPRPLRFTRHVRPAPAKGP